MYHNYLENLRNQTQPLDLVRLVRRTVTPMFGQPDAPRHSTRLTKCGVRIAGSSRVRNRPRVLERSRDLSPALAAHLDHVVIDVGIQLATATVLQVEGVQSTNHVSHKSLST